MLNIGGVEWSLPYGLNFELIWEILGNLNSCLVGSLNKLLIFVIAFLHDFIARKEISILETFLSNWEGILLLEWVGYWESSYVRNGEQFLVVPFWCTLLLAYFIFNL
jgi:hypothetical protein